MTLIEQGLCQRRPRANSLITLHKETLVGQFLPDALKRIVIGGLRLKRLKELSA
ncbi:MAG TPA: hypothetical protein VGE98_17190 [Thermoanaerobaculia bacterium]